MTCGECQFFKCETEGGGGNCYAEPPTVLEATSSSPYGVQYNKSHRPWVHRADIACRYTSRRASFKADLD